MGSAVAEARRKLVWVVGTSLMAAGVEPPPGTRSPWRTADKSALLAEIMRRQRAGESLLYGRVQRERWGKPLLRRAKTLFGSWKAALLEARVENS
jgi:hypothetical protein